MRTKAPFKDIERGLREIRKTQTEITKLEEMSEYKDNTALFRIGRTISDAHSLVSKLAHSVLDQKEVGVTVRQGCAHG